MMTPSCAGRLEPDVRVGDRMRRVATRALALSAQIRDGTEDISVFEDDPTQSGNATELESLGRLGGPTPSVHKVRFLDSATLRDASDPTVLTIPVEAQAHFEEGARLLRERKRRSDVTVSGRVIRLHRDEGRGVVVIKGSATDVESVHRYRVELSDDQYHDALVAHDRETPVAARGTLEIRGNFLWIADLKWFAVQQGLAGS